MREAPGTPVLRWFGCSTDITDIAEARAVLSRDRAELERLVAERTHDLQDTQVRLAHAARMQALGRLAGPESRTTSTTCCRPCRAVRALIERRAGDVEHVRRHCRQLIGAAERGAAITERLLAFSRRGDLRTRAVSVPPLLRNMKDILAHTIGAGIAISTRLGRCPGAARRQGSTRDRAH